MKAIFAMLGMFTAVVAAASTPVNVVPTTAFEFDVNRSMGPVGYKYSLGKVVRQGHTTAVGVWDFAQQGGGVAATSTNYDTGIHLPNKAIVRRVFFDTVTAPVNTLGGVSIGATANAAADLKSLLIYSSWATGMKEGIQDGTAAAMTKLTAARTVYMVISSSSAGTLTAGKIKIFVDYVVSE